MVAHVADYSGFRNSPSKVPHAETFQSEISSFFV